MRKLITVFAATVMIVAFTTRVTAQNQAIATNDAGAKIVATLTIVSDAPLNFGTMSVPNENVAVELTTKNVRNAVPSANIALMGPDLVTNAHYVVGGAPGYIYSIILPANNVVSIKNTNSVDVMQIDDFTALTTSVPGSNGLKGTLISGVDKITVGATLKVKKSQLAGTYTGKFDVTVRYD